MKDSQIGWLRIAVVVAELVLVCTAVLFPLVITGDVLTGFLRILELVAAMH